MMSNPNWKLGILCAAVVLGPAALLRAADDAAALKERLHRVAELNSIADPKLKPWHLKISYQLFDDKGKPIEQGTIEEWYSGEKLWKIVYTSPSFSGTDLMTGGGEYITSHLSVPTAIETVQNETTNPIPSTKDADASELVLRPLTMSNVPFDCIMLEQPMKQKEGIPLGLFPTYCLGQGNDSLRLSFDFGSDAHMRSRLGTFQGRQVPIDLSIMSGATTVITSHVDALEIVDIPKDTFAPTAALEKVGTLPIDYPVVAGRRLTSVPAVYPEDAKAKHVEGKVTLQGLIGTDGKIYSLRLVSAPSVSLALSAMTAVRQWTYEPYQLNGRLVNVDTTITVNFQMQ